MSEAQHTQGPWRYVHEPGYCGELIAQDGTTIAEFVVEPSLDNARLIAAAPELLAALEKIIEMNVQWALDQHGDATKAENMDCVRVARAAIAKAESNITT